MRIPKYQQGQDKSIQEIELSPSKIIGIGVNYKAHALEMGSGLPEEPLIFLIAPSALLPHEGVILRPQGYERVDFEGELGVVIGQRLKGVSEKDALQGVMGFVCVNDVTVRDLQHKDGQWTRAKGFDTFCPVGPAIVGGVDPSDLQIQTRVNGEIRQNSRTSELIFTIPQIIAHISNVMTLNPGDVITTGTPSGVGNLQPGDRVEVEIEGIGTLINQVEAGP